MTKQRQPGRPKTGRARDLGQVRAVTIEFPIDLHQALEAFSAKDERTKKAIVVRAIQAFLAQAGFWPPK